MGLPTNTKVASSSLKWLNPGLYSGSTTGCWTVGQVWQVGSWELPLHSLWPPVQVLLVCLFLFGKLVDLWQVVQGHQGGGWEAKGWDAGPRLLQRDSEHPSLFFTLFLTYKLSPDSRQVVRCHWPADRVNEGGEKGFHSVTKQVGGCGSYSSLSLPGPKGQSQAEPRYIPRDSLSESWLLPELGLFTCICKSNS